MTCSAPGAWPANHRGFEIYMGLQGVVRSTTPLARARMGTRNFVQTVERLAIAQRIAERLGSRQGQRTDLPANAGKLERGETADIAARKSGFGSADTMRRAQKVAETAAPELVDAMDAPERPLPARRAGAGVEPTKG